MNLNYSLVCLFGILALYTISTVAHQAIIGGKEAKPKDFEYVASLLEVNYGHICSGAILNSHFVLTAAHCFFNPNNTFKNKRVLALMGTVNLLEYEDPAVKVEVVKVYVPKEYNASDINTTGDIALVKLKPTFHVRNHKNIKTAKLERNQRENHSGEKAIIAGWGVNKIELQNNQLTGVRTDPLLRYSQTDILSNHQCKLEHTTSRIYSEHLCARNEQYYQEMHSVCQGDDGGPLVCGGQLIGILSKIPMNCAEGIHPAIYTRVSHYLTFIRNAKADYLTEVMKAYVLAP